MAFHQPQIHLPVCKVLPVTPNKITIPFHPLLKQIAAVLQFPEPVYHILDLSKNSAYVSVKTNLRDITFSYVGGRADTVEESCEVAAKKAVLNISKRWGVIVEDLTFVRYRCLDRCSRLYRLKRNELEDIVKGESRGDLEENVPDSPSRIRHVSLDYVPLLRKIFNTIAVQATPLETLRHCAGRYTSWITIQPLFNNASKEVFIGPACDTLAHAKSELARKVIMYLIPAYNLEIVDANYGSRASKIALLLYNLEQESYLTIRARMTGIPDEPAYSCVLVEQDDMAFENAGAHIPTITPAPVRARSHRSTRLASPENVVVCQAGPYPVFYKEVAEKERMASKRARNVYN
ncbi:uncharacterized protein LOC141655728 [Silene latifolia]|uniref:uncharacterized protein LOC141655728 n=1 Tax=Silene latifolia TaxID=37657 RepID=UPI003D77E29F